MLRCAIVLIALVFALPAQAAQSDSVRSERAQARLISDVDSVAPGQPFRIALHQLLAPGWHTYWTNPGDAGQPPELALNLPEGTSAGPLVFPAPHRLPFGPLVNFGYEKEATFTMQIAPPASLKPGERFDIKGEATWLVCEKICIPEEGAFVLSLPVEAEARPAAEARIFMAAEADQARPAPFAVRVGFDGGRGGIEVAGTAIEPRSVRDAFFFPDDWGLIDHAAPQPLQVRPGSFVLALTRGQAELPGMVTGIVAITDGAGIRSSYLVSAAPAAMPALGSDTPLWLAVLWALLGGLILNLMPCVFPILAMKAVSLARLGGAERAEIRLHAGAYTAGVILSFAALGGLLAALKAAGLAAGWGFQFTSPVFVTVMAWLMLAVGLNLSGVFNLSGPVALGSAVAARGGHAGAFATGMLAVLVATPCTAPFMAAAIGAALAMPVPDTMLVFVAMGIGMALPYALLAIFPKAAAWLPKPGAWMERLRQILAFPMYATAAWMIWVLTAQVGADGVLFGLGGAVLVAFAAWLVGLGQERAGNRFGLTTMIAGAALIGAFALLPKLSGSMSNPVTVAEAGAEPWSAERVRALQAEGRPVFVNLTAAWCISCKVNEQIIRSDDVRSAFEARKVAYLVGDWTKGDPAITGLLRQHGREGVPLYLFYPTGSGAPVILPQILTTGIVLQHLSAAPS